MRRKRVELQEAVIVAARKWVQHGYRSDQNALVDAVYKLDEHDAATLTGEGARWVRGAPETSREAAVRATPIQGSARYRVIKALEVAGRTDEQLERILGGKHQTVSSARNWLVEAGWVRDSGLRLPNRSRRQAVVWELTPAGAKQIGDL